MKKLIFGLIVALFFLGANVFADTVDLNNNQWCITNDSGDKLVTTIPITLLVPGKCRILKITVSPTGTSALAECYVGIYDASSETAMQTNAAKVCEGEWEADAEYESVTHDYARGLKIQNGATFIQGAYSAVTVEWERHTP